MIAVVVYKGSILVSRIPCETAEEANAEMKKWTTPRKKKRGYSAVIWSSQTISQT